MTALTLFDLAAQVRESVNQIDPDTGEIIGRAPACSPGEHP